MKLVIVESPTKARTISQFIGKGFHIESSFGHVRDLPKSQLGVDVENNFEPKYIIPLKARKNLNALKKKAAKAETIILATDEDREGEAIAWHLLKSLGLEDRSGDNILRIVFHEITKKAIEHALKNPRDIDMHLVDAQQARRILDRLVGYKLSPFLWKKVARGLSAGRVQSVAVRLIVERETEIEAFKKDEYWTVISHLSHPASHLSFDAQLIKIGEKVLDKFDIKNEAEAKKILEALAGKEAKVASVEKSSQKKLAPAPFTTSTLQQTAFQRLRFSAKQTMMFAQHLYEKGFITYMRTDSLNISEDALVSASSWIKENLGEKYVLPQPRKFKTKSKGAQEAHEAIRPTDSFKTPASLKSSLELAEARLYELIWKRFIATQLPDAVVEATKVDIDIADHIFRASGARLIFDGFMRIYGMKFTENVLPELFSSQGGSASGGEKDLLDVNSIAPLQHFTEPPPRYNEASLIKILEKFGIGRPSTYAPTLATIQDRGYVEKDNERRLRPTETGKIVNGILVEHFPEIVDIGFTAKMEEELDEVAEGKIKWQPLIKRFYDPFSKHLEEKYESVASQKVEEKTDEICPNCGKPMVIKRGRFGKFIACSGFPECKTTKRLPEPSLNMKCPTCVADTERSADPGDVIRRRTKKGRFFFGCSKYPACDFASWTLPGSAEDIKAKEKTAAKAEKEKAPDGA